MSPPDGGSCTGGGAPVNVAGGSGRAQSRAYSARRARTSGARSVRDVRSACDDLVDRQEEHARDRRDGRPRAASARDVGVELRHQAQQAAVGVEHRLAQHTEHARHPRAHPLAEARRLLRARDEVAHRGLLDDAEARQQARHLGVGDLLARSAASTSTASQPRATPPRSATRTIVEHGPRVLAPARGRQLRLAHGAVAVQLEEALERAPRGALGDRVEPDGGLVLDRRARVGVAPREVHDAHDADRGPRALEVADAAREPLREPVGADRARRAPAAP